MAKSKHKGKAKPERKGSDKPIPRGTAKTTLSKAHFFLKQADHSLKHMRDIEAYECYVEAAIHFAGSALYHLEREYGGRLSGETREGFKSWLKQRQSDPLIKALIDTRDVLVHAHPIRISLEDASLEDAFYPEVAYEGISPEVEAAHTKLPSQLDEIKAIIKDCEKQFK